MKLLNLVACAGLCANVASAGTLVAFGDEWTLSNPAYAGGNGFVGDQTATEHLAANLAALIGGTNYLILTTNGLAYGTTFGDQMTALGKSVTRSGLIPNLSGYDAVFLAGVRGSGSSGATLFSDFIDNGGSVVVSLGTGDFGNPVAEARGWAQLMNAYGLRADSVWTDPKGGPHLDVIEGAGALDDGLSGVAWGYGNEVYGDGTNPNGYTAITAAYGGGERRVAAVYSDTAPAVPLPAGLPLMLTGLAGLALARRR